MNLPSFYRTNVVYLQYSTREELTNKPQAPAVLPPGLSPSSSQQPQDACVLLVNVNNVMYPVTIELLFQVFNKYGPVTKIVIFTKNNIFHAFVQFAYSAAAATAKAALDGQNIYVGCCSLRINFSNTQDLDVKYNNDRSRDFTNPYLPPGPGAHAPPPGSDVAQPPVYPGQPYVDPNSAMGYPPPQPYPGMPPMSYAPPPSAGERSMHGSSSSVVIVSGLNEEKVNPDVLFVLFGVYGNVLKVKILFTKKDSALVQMATPQQAESVVAHLNNCTFFGTTVRVNFSKHPTIMSHNPTDENPTLTKEFLNSPLHRFKSPEGSFKNVCAPSATVHVSSIPLNVDEEKLRTAFSLYGEVVNVKFLPGEKRMALLQMASVEQAVAALIALHNYRFEETDIVGIRISFAKSAIHT